MAFDRFVALTTLQAAVGIALALLLRILYKKLRPEPYLLYWSFSWLVMAAYQGGMSVSFLAGASGTAASARDVIGDMQYPMLLCATLAWLQPASLALAALSLRIGEIRRISVAGVLFGTAAFGAFVLTGAWRGVPDPSMRWAVLVAPRAFLTAGATALFAVVYFRHHRNSRTLAGRAVAVMCALYAVHLLFFALHVSGYGVYGSSESPHVAAAGVILPLGISLSIAVSLIEEAATLSRNMSSVWEASLDGMRLTDSRGNILRVNQAFCRIVGKLREELEGQPLTCCYDAGNAGAMLEHYRQRFARRSIAPRMETQVTLWNGKRIWLDLSNSMVDSPQGQCLLSIFRDDTQRREAEEALRSSEERLQLALDSTNEGLYDWNLKTGLVFVNARFFRMLGYRPGEFDVTPERWARLVHSEDLAHVEVGLTGELTKGQDRFEGEYRMLARTGTYIWVAGRGQVIERDEAGRPARIVGTIIDITAGKHAEQEQERLRAQLAQSQKLEAVGRLAGGVAHDFNNLLTVINGYSKLALDSQGSPGSIRSSLQQIHKAGQRAAELTQQLLAFSRKQVMQPRVVSLNDVVRDAEKMLRWIAGEDIELETLLDADLAKVSADPGQLQQVLMNLVANARDAMPDGGLLRIETGAARFGQDNAEAGAPPAGDYAMLAVADCGIGMDDQTRAQIFEPFFTTKPSGRGTGLGLATVYGIVKQSGGHIVVDSAPGRGTQIRIYLPVAAVCAAPVPDARPRPEGGSETILLVEDETEVRRFAAGALRQFGYLVLEASRGEEALHIAGQPGRAIDLLVSDVMMPGMKGPELAARMKEVQRGTRVLFMSGYPDTDALHASAPGMSFTYLQKPFGPEVLAAKVREALGNRSNGGRVLVVDDEEVVRDLFRDVLESAGFEVGQASNGREALAEAKAQQFDLVLTDLVMPEQEGIETIRELRAQFPDLKIVAVSGAFEGRLLKVGQKMGANAALAKPVSPEDLLACVQGLLKHQPV